MTMASRVEPKITTNLQYYYFTGSRRSENIIPTPDIVVPFVSILIATNADLPRRMDSALRPSLHRQCNHALNT